ncbi:restriction endonuclease subunit S [Peptoniphilus sp. Marseille-Q6390]
MEWVRLGDLVDIKTGKLNANAAVPNGKYPFFTTAQEISRIDSYSYDDEVVLVSGNGDLNVKYYDGKFDAYQRTYMLTKKENAEINLKFLYFFMSDYVKILRNQSIGGVIKYIKLENLTEAKIPLLSLSEQINIVDILNNAERLIKIRKEQIQAYDDLIESLFFEMFGNPITNSKHFKTNKFINVVRLKRGYDLPVKSRIGNKYEVYGSNGVLDGHNEFKVEEPGIITGRSGTIGKVYRNEGMYWPLNTTLYSEKTYGNNVIFLEYLLKNFKLERFATGTGVPTLNRNIVHKEDIIEVPIELQNKFADYVLKIEEEKKKLNASLLELEGLFDSLMEDAFSGNLFKE